MQKSTMIGLTAGLVMVYGTIFAGEGWVTFFDPGSLVLVIGGTVAALLVSFSMAELKTSMDSCKKFFSYSAPSLPGYVEEFTELSRVARREGLLALDKKLKEVEDAFVKFGLEMAVDGIEEEEINDLMNGRIATELEAQSLLVKFFNNAGMFCPAFGMVGTLIGLIQMMQNLTDPAAIGAGMAVAMITTFYGALISNLVFLPCATKAKQQMGDVMKARDMVRTGILSIVRGESPSMVEKRLQLFLTDEAAAAAAEGGEPALKKAA